MRKYYTLIAVFAVLTFASNVFAQWNMERIQKAYCCYENSLNHPINGVVESAIINIMKMKLVCPDLDYRDLTKRLEKLSFEGNTKSIRYKAYIATNFLKHPERFKWIKPGSYEELNNFFARYEEKLAKQLQRIDNTLVASFDN